MQQFATKMLVIFFLFVMTATTFAQGRQQSEHPASLDQAASQFIQAYEQSDLKKMAAMYTPDAVASGLMGKEFLKGRAQIIHGFQREFKHEMPSIVSIEKITTQAQGNRAVASYVMTLRDSRMHAHPTQSQLRVTLEFVQRNHQWMISQSHFSTPLASARIQSQLARDYA